MEQVACGDARGIGGIRTARYVPPDGCERRVVQYDYDYDYDYT
jgi:hypothetical protein